MVLKRYTTITPRRRDQYHGYSQAYNQITVALNRPGFGAHFVMCEPRALTRLLSVVLFLCLR